MASKQSRGFRPGLEALEDRFLLAGGLFASASFMRNFVAHAPHNSVGTSFLVLQKAPPHFNGFRPPPAPAPQGNGAPVVVFNPKHAEPGIQIGTFNPVHPSSGVGIEGLATPKTPTPPAPPAPGLFGIL